MTTQNVERKDRSYGYCYTCRIAGHIHPADSPLAGCMTEDNGVRHSEKDGHVIRPWSLEDITKQDGGRRKLVAQRIAELLLSPDSPLDIVTIREGESIVTYDKAKNTGIWQLDGEQAIKQTVAEIVDASCDSEIREQLTGHMMDEVTKAIICRTYMSRADFAPPFNKIPLINGVYNFTFNRLEPHNRDNHFLYQVPIKYDANATCPNIDAFILDVLDEERKDLPKEIAGYMAMAEAEIQPNRWQRAFNFYGSGDNGKSKMFDLITAMLGKENVSTQNLQSVTNSRFAIACLDHKLANIMPDIGDRKIYRTDIFKSAVAGDRMTAENKFKKPYDFNNRAIMAFSCNTLPQTADETDAFFKRWIVIPFNKIIPHEKQDPEIIHKLSTPQELSGFFNASIAAYRKMCSRKRFTSEGETYEAKREQYDKLADPIKRFVDARISDDPDGWVNKLFLYEEYLKFVKEKGIFQRDSYNDFVKAIIEKTSAYRGRAKDATGAFRQVLKGIKLETDELPTLPTLPTLSNFIISTDPDNLKLGTLGKVGKPGKESSPVGDIPLSPLIPDPSKVIPKCADVGPDR